MSQLLHVHVVSRLCVDRHDIKVVVAHVCECDCPTHGHIHVVKTLRKFTSLGFTRGLMLEVHEVAMCCVTCINILLDQLILTF